MAGTVWRAVFLMQVLTVGACAVTCPYKLSACTKTVRPLLNNMRYMFPLNLRDVDNMCRMWSDFVDCIRQYMVSCTTERQRAKFNSAVSGSVKTVHSICSTEKYQQDYLSNAVCFKRVSVDSCGGYYQKMVEQVTNPEADRSHICCAYGQFKSCVSAPLLRNCGARAHELMEHSMAYLVSLCRNAFYARSYTCPTAAPPGRTTLPPATTTTTAETDRPRAIIMTTTSIPPPRTIIYPLPPTQRSRTAGAAHPHCGITVTVLAACAVSALYWVSGQVT